MAGVKYFLLLALMLGHIVAPAKKKGQPYIDSLLKELSMSAKDTKRVIIQDRLAFEYAYINPDEGLRYGNMALALAKELKWEKGIASAHTVLGSNYTGRSEYEKALSEHNASLDIYRKLGYRNSTASVLSNISLIYKIQGNYTRALAYLMEALKIKEEYKDSAGVAHIHENIGTIYLEQKVYDKALEYQQKALDMYRQEGNEASLARAYVNMGIVYDIQGDYQRALSNHLKALAINEKLGIRHSIQVDMMNVGIVYSHLKKYPDALAYQMKALEISKDLGARSSIAVNSGNIAETYLNIFKDSSLRLRSSDLMPVSKTSSLQLAISYYEEAVAICDELHFSAPQIEFMQGLSQAYSLAGDHEKALTVFQQSVVLKDSIFSMDNNANIANLETRRQLELKDKDLQINKLKAENKRDERILFTVGIILLLMVIVLVLKMLYDYKRSIKTLSAEKQRHIDIIKEQIERLKVQSHVLEEIAHKQAHDIRGPVATILGLCQLFNQKDYADPANKVVIDGIVSITGKLDAEVQEIIRKGNDLHKNEKEEPL